MAKSSELIRGQYIGYMMYIEEYIIEAYGLPTHYADHPVQVFNSFREEYVEKRSTPVDLMYELEDEELVLEHMRGVVDEYRDAAFKFYRDYLPWEARAQIRLAIKRKKGEEPKLEKVSKIYNETEARISQGRYGDRLTNLSRRTTPELEALLEYFFQDEFYDVKELKRPNRDTIPPRIRE